MKEVRRWALVSLAASTGALVLGFIAGEDEILILPLGVTAALGVIGEARESGWTPSIWFLAQAGMCAIASSSQVLALVSMSFALAYWDLSALHQRLRKAGRIHEPRLLLRRHLLILSSALVLGAALGIASIVVRIHATFAGALLSGLVVLAGLSLLLRRVRAPATQLESSGVGQAERNS